MTGFRLELNSPTQATAVEGVSSFVGVDDSGSFGIMAGHQRFLTLLEFGLARYRPGTGPWQYLAVPGGLLYFRDNRLRISTRRFVVDSDCGRVSQQLQAALRREEDALKVTRESMRQLEQAMFKRLWTLGRE